MADCSETQWRQQGVFVTYHAMPKDETFAVKEANKAGRNIVLTSGTDNEVPIHSHCINNAIRLFVLRNDAPISEGFMYLI